MRFAGSILAVLVTCAYAGAQSPDAAQLLSDAAAKAKGLRFSGVRIVSVTRGGTTETFREYVTKDGSKMRLEFEKGSKFEGQVIVELPEIRRHYFPDRNELREAPSFGRRQFEGMKSLRGGKPVVTDGADIAGLKTFKVTFLDSRKSPLLELNIDRGSGLALKRVWFSPDGKVSGSFEFESVKFSPKITKETFVINAKAAKVIRPMDELLKFARELRLAAMGFSSKDRLKLEFVSKRRIRGQEVLVLNYGNSESRVSLFVINEKVDPAQLQRPGSKSYAWKDGGVTMMLVGDVPGTSLEDLSKRVGSLPR